MPTLEEAIGIFEQLSKLCETNGIHDSQELYKQYAAWLRELVERRKAPEIVRCGECRHKSFCPSKLTVETDCTTPLIFALTERGRKGEPMDKEQAIETLRANYPDACYEQLREAVDAAIEALKAQDAAGDTISRQAAIDAIEKNACNTQRIMDAVNNLPSAQPERKVRFADKDHVWIDGKQYISLPRFQEAVKEASHEPQWIPVESKMPEEYGVYLVTEKYFSRYDECEYNTITTAYYGEDGFENNYKILAWMPLPEPYKPNNE